MHPLSALAHGLRRGIAALLVLACMGTAAQAAPAERWTDFADQVFRNYGQDEGLPSPVATALSQDGPGFLWVGTQGGLARWDGNRFRTYRSGASPRTLPGDWITALHTDPRGTLWVGATTGGLARYDPVHDAFIRYGGALPGLEDAHVSALADAGRGGLWIGTPSGLYRFDPASGRSTVLQHRDGDASSLPSDRVLALLSDAGGTLWVATRAGLARLPADTSRFVQVPLGNGVADRAAVSSLFADAAGRVWIGTSDHGLFVIDRSGAAPRPLAQAAPSSSGAPSADILGMTAGDDGSIMLGTYGDGILVVDPQTGHASRIVHNNAMPRSLGNDTVWALFRDRDGGNWAATSAGLSRLANRNNVVRSIFGSNGNPRSLSATDVTAVLATSDGHVWLGLDSKGIDIVDPVEGRIKTLLAASPDPGMRTLRIFSLTEWPGDGVFICTDRGLYHADLAGTSVTRFSIPGRDPSARDYASVAAHGKMWVGGGGAGLWGFVPAGDGAVSVDHYTADQLTDRRIIMLAAGRDNDLWIGTRSGVNRLDVATRVIDRIPPEPNRPDGLSAGYIASLLVDRAGRLWVATMGGGLDLLVDLAAGRPVFRRFGVVEGLPDSNVDAMLPADDGRLWVSTDGGIAVIDPSDFSVQALRQADGVAFTAYWNHAGAVAGDNELLFGAAGGGLTVIRPDRFVPWHTVPPIVITDAWRGGQPVAMGRFNHNARTLGMAADDTDLPHDGPWVIKPGANNLAVAFAALDYSDPQSNRYGYWLEGFDHGWIATDPSRRLASYTNLPPGAYTLHLRGSNRNGDWAVPSLDVPVKVMPAWWQTRWFAAGVVLAAVSGIVALLQSRTNYLRRRQAELERLVAERTAELEASKREIEQIAYHDALTGLPNRRLFTKTMREQINPTEPRPAHFALLLIDLDRFKSINDTLGHDIGDALLVEASRRLLAAVRHMDVVARLGGDEFAVIAVDLAANPAALRSAIECVCERIVQGFAAEFVCGPHRLRSSASIGVAVCPDDAWTEDALFKASDLALYDAKASGRGTWRWHRGSPRAIASR